MFSIKFALNHFLHQRKAKSRHGLHSPFVYRLVDEVIYDFSQKKVYTEIEKVAANGKKLNPTDKLLYRLVADANPQIVWILGKCSQIDQLIIQQASPLVMLKNMNEPAGWKDTTPPNVMYMDARLNPQSTMDYFNRIVPKMEPDTLLIVNHIQENMLTKTAWNAITSHPKVTASVNLFWMGLLYCRPGQVKEDFLIKF
jgi:hypothetical protein